VFKLEIKPADHVVDRGVVPVSLDARVEFMQSSIHVRGVEQGVWIRQRRSIGEIVNPGGPGQR
jgi:hypothetical protein